MQLLWRQSTKGRARRSSSLPTPMSTTIPTVSDTRCLDVSNMMIIYMNQKYWNSFLKPAWPKNTKSGFKLYSLQLISSSHLFWQSDMLLHHLSSQHHWHQNQDQDPADPARAACDLRLRNPTPPRVKKLIKVFHKSGDALLDGTQRAEATQDGSVELAKIKPEIFCQSHYLWFVCILYCFPIFFLFLAWFYHILYNFAQFSPFSHLRARRFPQLPDFSLTHLEFAIWKINI